jgi:hypothetical protein
MNFPDTCSEFPSSLAHDNGMEGADCIFVPDGAEISETFDVPMREG